MEKPSRLLASGVRDVTETDGDGTQKADVSTVVRKCYTGNCQERKKDIRSSESSSEENIPGEAANGLNAMKNATGIMMGNSTAAALWRFIR